MRRVSAQALANAGAIACIGVCIVCIGMLFIGVIALHIGAIGLSLGIGLLAFYIATAARAYAKGVRRR